MRDSGRQRKKQTEKESEIVGIESDRDGNNKQKRCGEFLSLQDTMRFGDERERQNASLCLCLLRMCLVYACV